MPGPPTPDVTTFDAIFFDAGETLFTGAKGRVEVYRKVARSLGLECSDTEISAAMEHAHQTLPRSIDGAFRYSAGWFRHFIAAVFGALNAGPVADRAKEPLFAAFADPRTFRLFQDVPKTLPVLRQSCRLGIISNWAPHLPRILEGLKIRHHFEQVLNSATEELEKPDPKLFLSAAARLGVQPCRCLHVGDHKINDFAGAKDAGMEAVLLDRDDQHPEVTPRIRDLEELLPPR